MDEESSGICITRKVGRLGENQGRKIQGSCAGGCMQSSPGFGFSRIRIQERWSIHEVARRSDEILEEGFNVTFGKGSQLLPYNLAVIENDECRNGDNAVL